MRIVILTSSRKSTASYCLPLLKNETGAEIVQVIFSRGKVSKGRKYYWKRLKKIWKIGLPGALNGFRIRSWFEGNELKKNIQDIEQLCAEFKIPYAEVDAIGSPDTIKLMKEASPDLAISLSNSYIPKKVFSIPGFGMINIHGEVLPAFQNAQSIIWQIFENQKETGYTIHKIDNKIDTGDILLQENYPIQFQDTLEDTVRVMVEVTLEKAGKGLVKVINEFDRLSQSAKPQGKGKKYTTPSIGQFLRMQRNFKNLKNKGLQNR
jgi:methionyl-tRNA formyltransferase